MAIDGALRHNDRIPLYLLLLAFACYGRVLFMKDIFWDDNCWLEAIYASNNLSQFLNAGFVELRRIPLGAFLYYFYDLHKLTDHAVLLWEIFNLAIQVVTPLLIYRLTTNLSSGNRTIGAAAAAFFIVVPLDHTLPYLSAINYRLGLLLSVLSLLLSERAVAAEKTRWGLLLTSLMLSLFTQCALTESAVALEPARALVFWHHLRGRGLSLRVSIAHALRYSTIFIAGMVPLILYKMLYRPFGMYEGIYKSDIIGLFNWKEHARLAWIALRGLWIVLLKLGAYASVASVMLGIAAALLSFFLLRRTSIQPPGNTDKTEIPTWQHCIKPFSFVLLFGITVLLLQHFMFAIVGRPLALGADSSHAALMQIGYAIIGGALILCLFSRIARPPARRGIATAALAVFIGLGVYFNNLNLDLYAQGSVRQASFWKTFMSRFPNLPPDATLFVDAKDPFFFYTSDLDNTYDLELYLNLLYAPTADAASFRRYRVLSIEDEFRQLYQERPSDIAEFKPVSRMTHFGRDILDPRSFIVVRYRDGELLVNAEILAKYPDVPYAVWARKPFPTLPDAPASYPLRSRAPGFS